MNIPVLKGIEWGLAFSLEIAINVFIHKGKSSLQFVSGFQGSCEYKFC